MKNTDRTSAKNSQQSGDTLIYILLILLLVLLIGGLGYWWWGSRKKPPRNYDYESELGKFEASPTAEHLSKLISGNRQRYKSVNHFLDDRMSRKLTDKEKAEVREELKNVNMEIDKTLQEKTISEWEKSDPGFIAKFYQIFYEWGKALTRVKAITSVDRDKEDLLRQQEFQKKWDVSKSEQKEIKDRLKVWVNKWYEQGKKEILLKYNETPLKYSFLPVNIEGRPANPKSQADYDYFLDESNERAMRGGEPYVRVGWKEMVAGLKKTPPVNFLSYKGFIRPDKDNKESKEPENTFGLTLHNPSGPRRWPGDPTRAECNFNKKNKEIVEPKQMGIRLKKELFFNRLGYEEWLTEVKDGGNRRHYFEISFETVVDTIAHELAHSLVGTTRFAYDGEEGGGHGKLFWDICDEMEKLVRDSPEYDKFKEWWKAPQKNV